MYEAYWQLDRKPFENCSDAPCYFPSESHQGALLKLRYAIENRRGAALLAGPSGCGKTLLVNLLQRQLGSAFSPFIHLVFPQMSASELLAYLVEELSAGEGPGSSRGVDDSVRRIRVRLEDNAQQDRHAVLVIDEAQLLDDTRVLEALRLLLNFEHASKPELTLLLVGQPGLLPVLERMPSLNERLGVKCLLRTFTLDETISYVNHRLSAAGAKRPIFEPAALELLHELTQGAARRINRLCDLALIVGFAEERRTIGAIQLETVSEELVTVSPE